jgi:hypothetical protein
MGTPSGVTWPGGRVWDPVVAVGQCGGWERAKSGGWMPVAQWATGRENGERAPKRTKRERFRSLGGKGTDAPGRQCPAFAPYVALDGCSGLPGPASAGLLAVCKCAANVQPMCSGALVQGRLPHCVPGYQRVVQTSHSSCKDARVYAACVYVAWKQKTLKLLETW